MIREILDACPRRLAGSASERRAHERLRDEFTGLGVDAELEPFRFNTHLYATLALHFGVATLGAALLFLGHPGVALALHLLAGISYVGDSTRRFYLLRRLFPWKPSQNLVATAPANGDMRLRVVLVGHVDAAYTGVLFHPRVVSQATKVPKLRALQFLRRSLLLATGGTLLLAVIDALTLAGISAPALWIVAALCCVGPVMAFVLNAEVVLRDEVVPGANDNLTGSAATVCLAARLVPRKRDDVELTFVVTGAEEAGTGGAYGLARDRAQGAWRREDTVVVAIDGLSNGELMRVADGELFPIPVAPWIDHALDRAVASDPRFARIAPFAIPAGATDTMPFLAFGYDGIALACVDPTLGAPRHYHRPSDTLENLDPAQLAVSIDFIERAVDELIRERLGA
ncbi:MAG: M28 family peptidase [Myxococcales bacterium]|nr:M28 family peptidase [Myxococcales bacterium]